MKQLLTCSLLALSVMSASAAPKAPFKGPDPNPDPNEVIKIGDRTLTRREARELSEQIRYQHSGGIIRRKGTSKGSFVLVNAQTVVPAADFATALKTIDGSVRIQVKSATVKDVTAATAKGEVEKASAQLGVFVVNKPDLPALIGAPEEGWAMVNVAKLGGEGVGAAVIASRTRREILRAFAMIAGALYGVTGDFVLQPIKTPDQLDQLRREGFGMATLHVFPRTLPYFGITPAQQATYRKACEEGWAPAPTNDVQKAIWDKVHQLPTKPIKILPETKPVKE